MALYKRLSLEERKKIKVLSNQGKGVNAIAKELNRAPSTISREICRTVSLVFIIQRWHTSQVGMSKNYADWEEEKLIMSLAL